MEKAGRKYVAAYGQTLSDKTGKVKDNRIEVSGTGPKIKDAMIFLRDGHVPRRKYEQVSAEALLEDPDRYVEDGEWVDYDGMKWEYA